MYRGKKVLVAGGTGTIGIPLVNLLLNKGAIVSVVANDDETLARSRLPEQIKYKKLDLTKKKSCELAVGDNQYVFNLIGIKGSVGIGETKVASYLVPMLRFQTNLMEAAFEKKVTRFLFVGSICSYPQSNIHFEENMWNGMPKQNDRIPGIAKRVGELLAESYYLEHGWNAVRIVRPANVYGPYDDFNPSTAQVIPALISRVINGENPLKVWGDGSAIRDFIYSNDAAFWLLEALEKAPAVTPINLGSGEGVSIKTVVETICKYLNPNLKVIWDSSKPSGDPCRVLSMEKAKRTINFKQKTNFDDGIKNTIEWYKRNYING